ncbi:MAG: hypothetical protein N4J56_003164 [Chroococcidiopsis sp. SAG 2025]|nr:cysteine peptidase family C39 domain-containing protein [Chroococcidiopsis sp. SAG 2025]MDV2993510.1 hypothetical protein [Chroococcidiopsis sp. SAG 2025]
MNQSLEINSLRSSDTGYKNLSTVEAVGNFLGLFQVDNRLASDFSKVFEIIDVQLGDELVNYHSAAIIIGNSTEHTQNTASDRKNNYFYIICQGRVRLLGFDPRQQREVSAMVLEAGETFGTENLCSNETPAQSLLTRAIAASETQVARIPLADFEPWLQQLPKLQDYLHQQTTQRQCLAFFKIYTELRSLPSHQLRQLLPYLWETRIEKGKLLAQATPPNTGCYWLRSGQIQSQLAQSQPPVIGQSWGYPGSTLPDWIAETDLVVYQLAKEYWESAQVIAPVLASKSTAPASERNGFERPVAAVAVSQFRPRQRSGRQRLPTQVYSTSSQSAAPETHPETKPESVAFPKPQLSRSGRLFGQRYPFVEQQSSSDCGVACLAMIGRYWGKQFRINTLRNLAGVGRVGVSLKVLGKTAENLGFHAKPVRASLSALADRSEPWIAHWEGDHFVVVYRVKGDRVSIADPAVGRRSLSRQKFEQGWTGYALLLNLQLLNRKRVLWVATGGCSGPIVRYSCKLS